MPLGANMDSIPERGIIFNKFSNTKLTLLFLAVEGQRKGGDIAFETLLYLQSLEINVQLIVCGCKPPEHFSNPDMKVVPFLNKNEESDYKKFVDILSTIHFLILPTKADCSSLVSEEANAYGVPSISSITGGIPDIVKDGINGFCLTLESRGNDYGKLIHQLYSDKIKYKKLVESSRMRFEESLNWPVWAEKFRKIID
ncbi:MAG: glycosyltransferase family 4 protein [Ignavibacteria bacterium]|nr:glycosyltransferase family 4 protein [Ignavibacteria bacterium]